MGWKKLSKPKELCVVLSKAALTITSYNTPGTRGWTRLRDQTLAMPEKCVKISFLAQAACVRHLRQPVPDFEFWHKIVFTKPLPRQIYCWQCCGLVCLSCSSSRGLESPINVIRYCYCYCDGPAPHIKCKPVCLSRSFILRNFYDQSRHFFSQNEYLLN